MRKISLVRKNYRSSTYERTYGVTNGKSSNENFVIDFCCGSLQVTCIEIGNVEWHCYSYKALELFRTGRKYV
jgi:hypothetical protein